ncbi:glucosamine--fructose-6-phosphate aminotransferase (isomerizing) [Rhizobium pisi]
MTQFAFDKQIASQAEAVKTALTTGEIPQLDPKRPVIFAGIGTSLHACKVAAYWATELSGGRIRPAVVETHDYALRGGLGAEDQIVVVSHRGTKRFPHHLFERAKQVGALTIAVAGHGAKNPGGDLVLRTCEDELASTHTVSYTTALAVLARLVAKLVGGEAGAKFEAALETVPDAIAETLAKPAPIDVLPRLINKEPIFLTGYGIDELSVMEAALKIKEGAYLWAESMSIELALHGTPAVFEPRNAAIITVPEEDDGGRTEAFLTMLRDLNIEALTLGAGNYDLSFAKVEYLVRPFVSIIPLQRLVAELARRRGSNPDTTRGDVEPYKSAIDRVRL